MRNFNEIFWKDVADDNVKCHKNSGLHPFSTRQFLEKLQGAEAKLTCPSSLPPPQLFKGQKQLNGIINNVKLSFLFYHLKKKMIKEVTNDFIFQP